MDSKLEQFIEKAKGDEGLKQRIYDAERATGRDVGRFAETITKIAADAGCDISEWKDRPDARYTGEVTEPVSDSCTLTCCIALTSTL